MALRGLAAMVCVVAAVGMPRTVSAQRGLARRVPVEQRVARRTTRQPTGRLSRLAIQRADRSTHRLRASSRSQVARGSSPAQRRARLEANRAVRRVSVPSRRQLVRRSVEQRQATARRVARELAAALEAHGYEVAILPPDGSSDFTRVELLGGPHGLAHLVRFARVRDTRVEISPVEVVVANAEAFVQEQRLVLGRRAFREALMGRISTLAHELEHVVVYANRRDPDSPPYVQHHNEPLARGAEGYEAYFTAEEDRAFVHRSTGAAIRTLARRLSTGNLTRAKANQLREDARMFMHHGRTLARASMVRSLRLQRVLGNADHLAEMRHPYRRRASREAFRVVNQEGEAEARVRYSFDSSNGDWTAEIFSETTEGWNGPSVEVLLRVRRNASLESRQEQLYQYLGERAQQAREQLQQLDELSSQLAEIEASESWRSLQAETN